MLCRGRCGGELFFWPALDPGFCVEFGGVNAVGGLASVMTWDGGSRLLQRLEMLLHCFDGLTAEMGFGLRGGSSGRGVVLIHPTDGVLKRYCLFEAIARCIQTQHVCRRRMQAFALAASSSTSLPWKAERPLPLTPRHTQLRIPLLNKPRSPCTPPSPSQPHSPQPTTACS